MECPYCHSEMEPGELYTMRDPMFWFPKGKRVLFPTKKRLEKVGAVRVIYYPAHERNDAWYCRMCKRMILLNVK